MEIESDVDRAAVESFFAANIFDPSRVPLLPRGLDPHAQFRSHILAIRDGDEIVAALHAAPPVNEVEELRFRGLPAGSGTAALRDYVMLYSLAVSKERRRQGLGAALLDRLESQVAEGTSQMIYGVCAADSAEFYDARGYEVLPPEAALVVKWGDRSSVFAITGDAQWFIKDLASKPEGRSALRPRFFHGGVGGLRAGDKVMSPATNRAAMDARQAIVSVRQNVAQPYAADPAKVYFATELDIALTFANRRTGDVYEIIPLGPIQPDTDYDEHTFHADAALIKGIVRRNVDLDRVEELKIRARFAAFERGVPLYDDEGYLNTTQKLLADGWTAEELRNHFGQWPDPAEIYIASRRAGVAKGTYDADGWLQPTPSMKDKGIAAEHFRSLGKWANPNDARSILRAYLESGAASPDPQPAASAPLSMAQTPGQSAEPPRHRGVFASIKDWFRR